MNTTPPDGQLSAQSRLRDAQQHYNDITEALKSALKQFASGEGADVRAFSSAVQSHWKALQTVQDREAELDERYRKENQLRDGVAIDLDAARIEVGRRLACLKTASAD